MNSYFYKLNAYIDAHPPNYGYGEPVLTMLYECHNESNPYDNEQIKKNFNEFYRLMNGMELGRCIELSTQCASSVGIMSGLDSSQESKSAFRCRQN